MEARHHVWAVMGAVEEAVGREEMADILDPQFPSEFASILSTQDW